jgi:stage V sporulation protein R
MDKFINPQDFLEEQRETIRKEREKRSEKYPIDPVKDILLFLIDHAPIKPWQRDILSIIRDEAYYFVPQGQTKVMNEGWASYWHSKLMTEKILSDAEFIDFADHHSGTVAQNSGRLNPYKLGLELFRDIEERWNKGRFGKDYDDCDDMVKKAKWDTGAGLGREKIFEVRKLYCDLTFLDTFLTPDFCARHKFFTYAYNQHNKRYEISNRDFKAIKEQLLFGLGNFGQPYIYLVDANYKNRSELLLEHKHFGIDLDLSYGREVITNLFTLWKRPIHIATRAQGEEKRYSFDGKNFSEG